MSLGKGEHKDENQLPPGIAAAFGRDLRLVANAAAFVDRVQAVGGAVDNCIAWRWSGAITGRQLGDMLRTLRRSVEANAGEVTDNEFFAAEDVERREVEMADLREQLAVPINH